MVYPETALKRDLNPEEVKKAVDYLKTPQRTDDTLDFIRSYVEVLKRPLNAIRNLINTPTSSDFS